jgi:glycosyltransferase involved in cell wall biosynthesis
MENPKVLQICRAGETLRRFVLPLIEALATEGFQVEAAASIDEHSLRLKKEGYAVHFIPLKRTFNAVNHLVTFMHLLWIIKKGKYSYIHTHGVLAGLIGNLAARIAGIKNIFYTPHGLQSYEASPLSKPFYRLCDIISILLSDVVFCTGKEELWGSFINSMGFKKELVYLPGVGINTSKFLLPPEEKQKRRKVTREKLNIGESEKVVIIVARLVKHKGVYEFLEAVRILYQRDSGIRALIVGDGPERRKMEEFVNSNSLKGVVHILGEREDVPDLLCASDVFVLPSYGFGEGLPIAPLEAMAIGLPVVLTDVKGCREEVKDGVNGFLVPPKDPLALAEALWRILNDPMWAQKMGENGKMMSKEFDRRKIMQTIIEVYKRGLEKC